MNVGTCTPYPTKKALKEAVKQHGSVSCYGTSLFGPLTDGQHCCVGPDPYTSRKWYATVDVRQERIVKVIA